MQTSLMINDLQEVNYCQACMCQLVSQELEQSNLWGRTYAVKIIHTTF